MTVTHVKSKRLTEQERRAHLVSEVNRQVIKKLRQGDMTLPGIKGRIKHFDPVAGVTVVSLHFGDMRSIGFARRWGLDEQNDEVGISVAVGDAVSNMIKCFQSPIEGWLFEPRMP